ncbi:hypothetical protein BDZ89DRAFT_263022 [Hymenopellis radicata]|nr:hypothetical protein BDZ89DRAFT_263022 [Hymenopellis radicata]
MMKRSSLMDPQLLLELDDLAFHRRDIQDYYREQMTSILGYKAWQYMFFVEGCYCI